jgi:hypothetical protein
LDAKQKEALEVSAYRWVSKCEDVISSWSDCKEFVLHKCVLDWSPRRRSSRGGWYSTGPGINIAMAITTKPKTIPYRMYEYPSFDSDSVIGGFYSEDLDLALGMTICHEMAHAVQFFRVIHLKKPRGKPHGPDFKTPYSMLRKALINPHIHSQTLYKERYDKLVKETVKGVFPLANDKELDHLFGVFS